MSFKLFGVNIKIHFLFTVMVSLLLCIDKCNVAIYSLLSVMIHEAGHAGALCIVGQKPNTVMLCASGVQIKTDCVINSASRFFVAVCGPLANILPVLFISNTYFKTAMLVNGVFNLIPVNGTDGSDMLDCLLLKVLPTRVGRIAKTCLNAVVISTCFALGIVIFNAYANPTLLMSALYFTMLFFSSCK